MRAETIYQMFLAKKLTTSLKQFTLHWLEKNERYIYQCHSKLNDLMLLHLWFKLQNRDKEIADFLMNALTRQLQTTSA